VITLRLLDTSFVRFLQTLRVPLLGSALMAAVVYAVMALSSGLPQLARLLLAVAVGAAVYIGVSARYDREFLERGLRLLLGKQPRKDAARPAS